MREKTTELVLNEDYEHAYGPYRSLRALRDALGKALVGVASDLRLPINKGSMGAGGNIKTWVKRRPGNAPFVQAGAGADGVIGQYTRTDDGLVLHSRHYIAGLACISRPSASPSREEALPSGPLSWRDILTADLTTFGQELHDRGAAPDVYDAIADFELVTHLGDGQDAALWHYLEAIAGETKDAHQIHGLALSPWWEVLVALAGNPNLNDEQRELVLGSAMDMAPGDDEWTALQAQLKRPKKKLAVGVGEVDIEAALRLRQQLVERKEREEAREAAKPKPTSNGRKFLDPVDYGKRARGEPVKQERKKRPVKPTVIRTTLRFPDLLDKTDWNFLPRYKSGKVDWDRMIRNYGKVADKILDCLMAYVLAHRGSCGPMAGADLARRWGISQREVRKVLSIFTSLKTDNLIDTLNKRVKEGDMSEQDKKISVAIAVAIRTLARTV